MKKKLTFSSLGKLHRQAMLQILKITHSKFRKKKQDRYNKIPIPLILFYFSRTNSYPFILLPSSSDKFTSFTSNQFKTSIALGDFLKLIDE